MSEKVERVDDHLADFTRDKRILILSLMALAIGAISAGVAYVLVWLISVITSIAFYQRFSSDALSPAAIIWAISSSSFRSSADSS